MVDPLKKTSCQILVKLSRVLPYAPVCLANWWGKRTSS